MRHPLLRPRTALAAVSAISLGVFSLASGCGTSLPDDCASLGTCPGGDASADGGGSDGNTTDGGGDVTDGSAQDSPTTDAPSDTPMEANIPCDGGIVCNGSCVDPGLPTHCGSCGNVCPVPTNGTATCAMPNCGIQCNSTFHACQGSCLPNSNEPGMDACVIDDSFGVFVSPSGLDTNACTKASPCKTIGKGMTVAKAASKRVYVCEGTYAEQLVVDGTLDNIKVYGGFSCAWVYDVNKKPLVAPLARGYAMVISTPTSALFEDVAFQAQAGSAAGDSSIAIFAKNAAGVVLKRCNVTAGPGVAGTDQTQPAPFGSAAPSGIAGTNIAGGSLVTNPACTTSTGGIGGGPAPTGVDGADGTPGASNKGTVAGCQSSTGGGVGSNGGPGGGGAGASTWATFSSGGWSSSSGTGGGVGAIAQGGGGGASIDLTGGGGSGGAGGCGGTGGAAGTGGGSSIAVLVYSSNVDLETCTLTSASGGRGGNGAAGQTGQTGGTKGGFAGNACPGGKGGNGGNGGAGGGGAGGLSAGIVWLVTAPTVNGVSTPSATTLSGVTLGALGAGGTGANAGKAGVAAAVVQFQ